MGKANRCVLHFSKEDLDILTKACIEKPGPLSVKKEDLSVMESHTTNLKNCFPKNSNWKQEFLNMVGGIRNVPTQFLEWAECIAPSLLFCNAADTTKSATDLYGLDDHFNVFRSNLIRMRLTPKNSTVQIEVTYLDTKVKVPIVYTLKDYHYVPRRYTSEELSMLQDLCKR